MTGGRKATGKSSRKLKDTRFAKSMLQWSPFYII